MSGVVGVDVGKKKFSKRYKSIHILINLPGLVRDLITRVTFRFLCKSFIIFTTRQTLSNTVFTKNGFFFSHFEFFSAQQIILLLQMQHKFNIKFTNKHGSSFSLEKKKTTLNT